MILTCPECKSRYVVNPNALMPRGRTVRCAKCRHSWFEAKPDQEVEIVPEQVTSETPAEEQETKEQNSSPEATSEAIETSAEPSGEGSTDTKSDEASENADAASDFDFPISKPRKRKRPVPKGSNLPALQNQKYGSSKAGWISLFIFLTVVISSFLLLEDTIKESWPATGKLYRAIGLDTVNAQPSPPQEEIIPINDLLKVRGLTPRLEQINNISHLFIAGYVENVSDDPQVIPPLKVVLKDIDGQDIRNWSFTPDVVNIAAGEQVNFETSLPSPPAEARDISVILTNP